MSFQGFKLMPKVVFNSKEFLLLPSRADQMKCDIRQKQRDMKLKGRMNLLSVYFVEKPFL